ncbi:MAG: efflux RND transporter periplasmic adaptor subunit [Saprospiraceae bacterium]|nr:efflux RND transporter periplasmic adaptor subunit [Saprospiraceae bacterium]MCB9322291.1 efflux RND transporter periplasmic adaptor subunit [Lewinellaceae bacterium]
MESPGMDRRIEKKKWSTQRILYLAGIALLFLLVFFVFKNLNKKVYKLDPSKISVKKVEKGDFQDMILIDGDVEPIKLVLVNTLEGGAVEDIFIEDGVRVTKGTPLLRLSNPSVTLGYMNQETAIVEQINNLRNLKLSLEKDQRNLAESLIDSENNFLQALRSFKTDSALFVQHVIAENDFIKIRDAYDYRLKKRDFMEINVKKSEEENRIQIKQINNSVAMMEQYLELIHENMEKMLVKAPVSGMLSSFDPDLGESFLPNQTVAKIDVQSGFKINGQVDEYYLNKVQTGQRARFSFDGQLVNLKVAKVLPEVVNRRFQIELEFEGQIPKNISIGQSLQLRLELSDTRESIMIPRGNYFQSSGGQYVYVLDDEGEAHKRYIKLGSQNPSYYEVLEGLEVGERFITSSYDEYKNFETIVINN